MPKFKVLRPIEHSLRLYVPEGEDAPEKVRSAASGAEIPVDASGSIDLSEEEAAPLKLGQIQPVGEPKALSAKPDPAPADRASK